MALMFDLINRLIELVRYRDELRHRLYDDFVAPLMADFKVVHQDYVNAFRRYRDALVRHPVAMDKILEDIVVDGLFTADLRAKLRVQLLTDSDPRLKPLVTAMIKYLRLASAGSESSWRYWLHQLIDEPGFDELSPRTRALIVQIDAPVRTEITHPPLRRRSVPDNAARSHLHEGIQRLLSLHELPEQIRAEMATRLIDALISTLQDHFAVIAKLQAALRRELTAPG